MELTEQNLLDNENRFIDLLSSIDREGITDLIDYLKSTDFFYAPASTKYHGNFKGGLCLHSLYVYDIMKQLFEDYIKFKGDEGVAEVGESYEEAIKSITIVSLLHDLSKTNLYEETITNKKVYSEDGSKYDTGGRYDWQPVKGYKTREEECTFVIGNHEETSEFIARQFIPLRVSESAAIMHHHGGVGWDSIPVEAMSKIYNKYTLALLLHEADLFAAYKFV